MAENSAAPVRRGMTVRRPRSFSGENRHHYYTQLIEVLDVVNDPDYGGGIAGYSALTGKPVIVFSNPNLSESRKNARNVKTMTDWVNGLRISGRSYTFGPGSWVLVQDVTTRAGVPPRRIKLEGHEVMADVLFCQWISSWQTTEQANPREGDPDPKQIFWGYGIAAVRGGTQDHPEQVTLHFFEPKGVNHPMGDGKAPYDVVFRFSNLDDLLNFIDSEHRRHPDYFSNYMVRVIEKDSGLIVGRGEIIGCKDYRNPDTPRSENFLKNLARRLSLTTKGIEQLISDPEYVFEMYGLQELLPGLYSSADNDGRLSLSEQVLNNEILVRRDAPRADNGVQCELVAVPVAVRGRLNTETGGFWLDKAQVIGYVGRNAEGEYSLESDIISADAYSGVEPDRKTGHIRERGLDRVYPKFVEGEREIEVDSIKGLARSLGCDSILYPDGRWSQEVFEQSWDRRENARPARQQAAPARPARRPEAAPEPEYEDDAAQAAPVRPARQQAAPARPARRPEAAPEPEEAPARPMRAARPASRQPEPETRGSEDYAEEPAPARPARQQAAPGRPMRAARPAGRQPEPDYDQPLDDMDGEDVPF